jgi:tetratricopeptide (TPR) repeat protein
MLKPLSPQWAERGRRGGLPNRSAALAGAAARWALTLLVVALLLAGEPGPLLAQAPEAEVFVAKAIVAYEEKRYEDALADLGEALRLDPGNIDALYYTGLANIALQRYDLAREALERARKERPGDLSVLFQLGVLYFGMGRYEQAQPLLEEVFRIDPSLDGLGYYVGFMRYRAKDYQGALRAFRATRTTDPEIAQLTRFYSGLALGVLGLPREATAELDEALRLAPTSPLTGPAERLRGSIIATTDEQRRFRAQVRVGFLYDTNVAVIPNVTNDPLVQALQGQDTESPGELGSVRFDYAFLRRGGFEAVATLSAFGIYYNKASDFSLFNPLGAVGVTYRGSMGALPYQASLQYAYDYFQLGSTPFVQRNTIVPSLALLLNSWNLSLLEARIQTEQFFNQGSIPPQENRNGIDYMVGLSHVMQFLDGKLQGRLGYQFDWDDTRGSDYQYIGNRVIAGASYTLPWFGITVSDNFDVWLRNYLNVNAVFPITAPNTVERFDTQYTNVLSIGLPLSHGLALSLDWQYINQQSNIDVFAYKRNVVSLIMTWTY